MYAIYGIKTLSITDQVGLRGKYYSKVILDDYIKYYQLDSVSKTMTYRWLTEVVLSRTDELIIISTPGRFYDMRLWLTLVFKKYNKAI